MSTPCYWLKKHPPQQPFRVVTSVDGGKRFWQDWTLRLFQGLFVVANVFSSTISYFIFSRTEKRPVGWKTFSTKQNQHSRLSHNVQVSRRPRTAENLCKLPSPITAFNQVPPGSNVPVGCDIPAGNFKVLLYCNDLLLHVSDGETPAISAVRHPEDFFFFLSC